MSTNFNIPIVLFLYKRYDLTLQIINRLKLVRPTKIYLLWDGGKTNEEQNLLNDHRKIIERAIDWKCEIIKKYHSKNVGIFGNLALGVKWIFEREEIAVFLEEDNLPHLDFFKFCEAMLSKYKETDNIIWICGTNYLENKYENNKDPYFFTKQLLPCGWASWSNKFLKYYDPYLKEFDDNKVLKNQIKKSYLNKWLFFQQYYNFCKTKFNILNKNYKELSWDFQMAYTIRANNLFGIVPKVNLIENIGVDNRSTHGGSSMQKEMTRRFCDIKSFPLKKLHSKQNNIKIDVVFEKEISNVILIPRLYLIMIFRFIKPFLGFKQYESFNSYKKRITKF